MKLFLDDSREIPINFDMSASSYAECILLLSLNDFEFVSLDYDLGIDEATGYDVLVWMSENEKFPEHINIHSNHADGCAKMREYINENFPPKVKVTYRTLKK